MCVVVPCSKCVLKCHVLNVCWSHMFSMCVEVPCSKCVLKSHVLNVCWRAMFYMCVEFPCSKRVLKRYARNVRWSAMLEMCVEAPCFTCVLKHHALNVCWSAMLYTCVCPCFRERVQGPRGDAGASCDGARQAGEEGPDVLHWPQIQEKILCAMTFWDNVLVMTFRYVSFKVLV